MVEKDFRSKFLSIALSAFLIVSFALPCSVFAQGNKPETNKVAPLKSFFSKFIKKKSEKPVPVKEETNISTLKGGVVMTIDDCVNMALKNSPTVKNYKNTQQVQKNAVGIAKSNYFPVLVGGTGYHLGKVNYFGDINESENNNYYGLDVGVSQLIWDFGYTKAKINMNKFNYEASGYDLDYEILNTIHDVKIAYTKVLNYRANEDIYERSVKINELNVERTKAMYEVGLRSKIDLVSAESTLTEMKISLLEAQNLYQTALINLNNQMYYVDAPDYMIKDTETFNFQKNYSVKNEIDVSYDRKNYNPNSEDAHIKDGAILTSGIEKRDILKTYSFKPFDMTLQESIAKAYENRPDFKSIQLVKRASDEALKAIKRSYMPEINATGGYSLTKRTEYGSHALSLYAGMDLPNINIMSIKNQIQQGQAYLDIAMNNVDLLKKNIYFEIQNYYMNMKQLEKRIPLKSKQVEEKLEMFELADGRYAVGVGDYLQLQQAQTDYNQAQLDFVQSVFQYNQARFQLEHSIGLK